MRRTEGKAQPSWLGLYLSFPRCGSSYRLPSDTGSDEFGVVLCVSPLLFLTAGFGAVLSVVPVVPVAVEVVVPLVDPVAPVIPVAPVVPVAELVAVPAMPASVEPPVALVPDVVGAVVGVVAVESAGTRVSVFLQPTATEPIAEIGRAHV